MKLVILDRDGVINYDSDAYIKSTDEFIPIPGSIAAISRLNQKGYLVAIATNQSGVGRGYYSLETLTAIHQKLNQLVEEEGGEIAAIAFCLHHPDDDCQCRKPKPGLLLQIGEQLSCPLNQAYFVGDSLNDVEAALAVGAQPVLVRTGKPIDSHHGILSKCPTFDDLGCFVDSL